MVKISQKQNFRDALDTWVAGTKGQSVRKLPTSITWGTHLLLAQGRQGSLIGSFSKPESTRESIVDPPKARKNAGQTRAPGVF